MTGEGGARGLDLAAPHPPRTKRSAPCAISARAPSRKGGSTMRRLPTPALSAALAASIFGLSLAWAGSAGAQVAAHAQSTQSAPDPWAVLQGVRQSLVAAGPTG